MDIITLDRDVFGYLNNKKIIGSFNTKEFFLSDTFGKVYYSYDGISEELINSSVHRFDRCLELYNECVEDIQVIQYPTDDPSNLLSIYSLHQAYLHHITLSDFECVKSFFWQEKLYDVDVLVEDEYLETLQSQGLEFLQLYVQKQISLNIQWIEDIDDYKKIDQDLIVEKVKKEFSDSFDLVSARDFVVKTMIVDLYGKIKYEEILEAKNKRILEIFGPDGLS